MAGYGSFAGLGPTNYNQQPTSSIPMVGGSTTPPSTYGSAQPWNPSSGSYQRVGKGMAWVPYGASGGSGGPVPPPGMGMLPGIGQTPGSMGSMAANTALRGSAFPMGSTAFGTGAMGVPTPGGQQIAPMPGAYNDPRLASIYAQYQNRLSSSPVRQALDLSTGQINAQAAGQNALAQNMAARRGGFQGGSPEAISSAALMAGGNAAAQIPLQYWQAQNQLLPGAMASAAMPLQLATQQALGQGQLGLQGQQIGNQFALGQGNLALGQQGLSQQAQMANQSAALQQMNQQMAMIQMMNQMAAMGLA